MEQLCTRVGIIERGHLIAEGTPAELAAQQVQLYELGADDAAALRAALAPLPGAEVVGEGSRGRLRVQLSADRTPGSLNADLAAAGVTLSALVPLSESLKSLFMSMTSEELT